MQRPQAAVASTGVGQSSIPKGGRAYTERAEPKLALVEVELQNEAFAEGWEPNHESFLVLKAPGMDILKVPLSKSYVAIDGISIWEWSGTALDKGAEAFEWLLNYLGKPSRLVRFNAESETRVVHPNSGVTECIESMSFRARAIQSLQTQVPAISQENGIAGPEPTQTLEEFRSDKDLCLTKSQNGRVYTGQNLACKESVSAAGKGMVIDVGDPMSSKRSVLLPKQPHDLSPVGHHHDFEA